MDRMIISLKLRSECTPLKLNRVSPGQFLMGSNEGMGFDDVGETPMGKFTVVLSKEYWLGAYPVTQCQWHTVMGTRPSCFKGPNHPVETISWYEAMEFCHQLNVTELPKLSLPNEYSFHLPTEAQWEYACKANSLHKYQLGDMLQDLSKVAWHRQNIPEFSTQAVGQKEPNDWGFYDMLGNVSEWCFDIPEDYPDGTIQVDWVGSSEWGSKEAFRIMRGGNMACEPNIEDKLTCTGRSYLSSEDGRFWVGFRLCLGPKIR